jgi:hypothetical protein
MNEERFRTVDRDHRLNDVVYEFQQAFEAENVAALCESLERIRDSYESGAFRTDELMAAAQQMRIISDHFAGKMKSWRDTHPEFIKQLNYFEERFGPVAWRIVHGKSDEME